MQKQYSGLDAFAGILLYKYNIAHADPIHFTLPPEESELLPATPLRLYTKNSQSFVAQGSVVETIGDTSRRVKVALTAIGVPGAFAPHPKKGNERQPLLRWSIGEHVLWDTVRNRVLSLFRRWRFY